MKRIRNLTATAMLILSLATAWGCASTTTNAYKVLASGKVAYQGVMNAAGDAYKQGLIGEEEKEVVIDLGNRYWAAHQSAATALEAYAVGETDETKDRLAISLTAASDALGSLLDNWDLIKGGG
jgi:hypothetical protein